MVINGWLLLNKGGIDMTTYEAINAFCTIGLLVVAVIDLRQSKK